MRRKLKGAYIDEYKNKEEEKGCMEGWRRRGEDGDDNDDKCGDECR